MSGGEPSGLSDGDELNRRYGGMAIKKFLGRIAVGRVLGEHPSPIKALAASAIVGTAVGGLTYRLLRDGGGADKK